MKTKVKTEEEIQKIRESGRILSEVLTKTIDHIEVGMTTQELADFTKQLLTEYDDAEAAFFGYLGFPHVICISVNDAVVHGIPNDYRMKEGDLIGLDFGVNYRGMITDSARTVIVGTGSEEAQKLVKDCRQALFAGIDVLKNGVRVGDIGAAVEASLKGKNYGIVEDLVGHGVGHKVHEEPNIPNTGIAGTGATLKSGMTIAIEPMITLGTKDVYVEKDGWTIKSKDNTLTAHFEHTVLITDNGYEILTQNPAT